MSKTNLKFKESTELNYHAYLESMGISPIADLDSSRIHTSPAVRLEQARSAALKFREQMLSDDERVSYFQSISLIRAPYPTKYGLLNANTVKSPFMHILNRMFVIQFDTEDGKKTLLFSPSDFEANTETPYFKRMLEKKTSQKQSYLTT